MEGLRERGYDLITFDLLRDLDQGQELSPEAITEATKLGKYQGQREKPLGVLVCHTLKTGGRVRGRA